MGNQNPILLALAVHSITVATLSAVVVRESLSPIDTGMPDPIHAPYLDNVGYFSAETPRSAVYLGKGLVLSSFHGYRGRGEDRVWFLGDAFDFDPKRTVRMRNPSWTGLDPKSDLVLIRLEGMPNLPELKIAARPPFGGERVILAGHGKMREGGRTLLDTVPGYRTRTPEPSSQGTANWGENLVEAGGLTYRTPDGDVLVFATIFNDGEALALEAQAGGGDSGGAVFVERGSGWELAGIIEAVGPGALPPEKWTPEGAPFGAATYATDLTVYREQILAPTAVPEPSVMALLALAPLWLVRRRRRGA